MYYRIALTLLNLFMAAQVTLPLQFVIALHILESLSVSAILVSSGSTALSLIMRRHVPMFSEYAPYNMQPRCIMLV